MGGIQDISCRTPLLFRPAQAYGISWARTSIESDCGRMHLAYKRSGMQQCVKVPEGRSAARPVLQVVPDVTLSCGEQGGIISSIDFASWGLPG